MWKPWVSHKVSWKSTHWRRPGIAQELVEVRIGRIGRPSLEIVTLECKMCRNRNIGSITTAQRCKKMEICKKIHEMSNMSLNPAPFGTQIWCQCLTFSYYFVVDLMRFVWEIRGRELSMPSSGSLTEKMQCYLYSIVFAKWVCLKIGYLFIFLAYHNFSPTKDVPFWGPNPHFEKTFV